MLPLIQEKREALAELCRRYHVKSLALFGSALRDDFDPERSDLDFLVEFGDVPEGQSFHEYFDLQQSLKQLFGREIDLIEFSAIRNPYLRSSIESSYESVYAA